jgi:hypothetical protein
MSTFRNGEGPANSKKKRRKREERCSRYHFRTIKEKKEGKERIRENIYAHIALI